MAGAGASHAHGGNPETGSFGGSDPGASAGFVSGGHAGMNAMGGTESIAGTSSCGVNTMDTNQGLEPPAADTCPGIGATLKSGHDQALKGQVLNVAPLAGKWADGSGSARVELVLDAQGSGSLRFGQASDFPAISDANEAFLSDIGERDSNKVFDLAYEKEQLGFSYSVIADSGKGSELSFHVLIMQPWESWCALQAPVPSPYSRNCYACMYDAGLFSFYTQPVPSDEACEAQTGCFASNQDSSEAKRVHCGRLALCLLPYDNVCICSADACFANLQNQQGSVARPYGVTLDPIDTKVLRLTSNQDTPIKYYLEKQE
ncbi:MAG: hypothetical protein WDO69_28620 [Pseudomonadota bacterium]